MVAGSSREANGQLHQDPRRFTELAYRLKTLSLPSITGVKKLDNRPEFTQMYSQSVCR